MADPGGAEATGSSSVRKRRREQTTSGKVGEGEGEGNETKVETSGSPRAERDAAEKQMEPGSYWLTRIVFIRALGFIYCNAHINTVALIQLSECTVS